MRRGALRAAAAWGRWNICYTHEQCGCTFNIEVELCHLKPCNNTHLRPLAARMARTRFGSSVGGETEKSN